MKNFIVFSMVSALILISCAGSQVVVDTETAMRGDWTISSVTIDGINQEYVDATVFDEANTKCYEGSTWHLVQNNNSGTYTMNGGGDCPSGTTKIKWFVSEENGATYFNFKRIYDGQKPKNVLDGYRMRIVSNSGSSMILKQDLMFEGKPIGVNYSFIKN
ncbi:MAG: lipocalin family protein [Weeksellaceae bacterium]